MTERWMPAVFVVLWATGFISAKYGLPYAPPAKFLLVRFALVVVLMLAVTIVVRAPWPARARQVLHLAIAGVLVHALYLYGVFAALALGMSAGLVSLIVGTQPILTALAAGLALGERVRWSQWVGLVLGLGGTALVVANKLTIAGLSWAAIVLACIGLAGITAGTLYQKRYCGVFDLRAGSVVQFLAAAIVLTPLAAIESRSIVWTGEFVFALSWVVIVMSIAAISLLALLIRRGTATAVTSIFYLVPPVTAVMAYALFGETLSAIACLGMLLSVLGVAIVVRR
jgi:drug/metabolite transporter (DMT)-like permease